MSVAALHVELTYDVLSLLNYNSFLTESWRVGNNYILLMELLKKTQLARPVQ